ncbi:uncharacterized protein GLRG_06682 [Colletotrichum graminicola M1.001]|uniref:Uncharacterized protein n=1 Tax=Colletotrichum graminicola (strain M1.001 / M2 / FGSC 10212) TaxID=645133 RepID=E3QLG9_COLGM|nr:uncharacterized protein GLRG_06682 [Colletotrichum graminicola M1.001]EFQ31707.1 hypothetical protein GLRG_06682 [Colletotrichum graminicola M1.001]
MQVDAARTGLELSGSAIICMATMQTVENTQSAIVRITSTVGLVQLNLEELQFSSGICACQNEGVCT